jgi:hypothetical protein
MWCPKCEQVTVCTAVDPASLGNPSGQRWYRPDHADIQWFRRGRVCLTCGYEFLTAETREQFLQELVELREALRQIKVNAEAYVAESSAAAEALSRLSESLSVLRALRVYQETPGTLPPEPVPLNDEEQQLARTGNRVAAVQSLRQRTGLGLAEALERVNAFLAEPDFSF